MANLTQLKMLEDLNGFLLIDKPEHIPFAAVVKAVKRKFNLVKVGHGGSLDAQASGLLVLLINDANKFVDNVMGADREYEGTLDFTRTTDTGDAWGREERTGLVPADEPDLATVKGDVFLSEPRFAAIRREGSAGYEVVDTGDHAQVMGHVYRIELKGNDDAETAEDAGSRGFFMRATKQVLPRALAKELGATLTALRRTRVWKFEVKDAIAFDRLLETGMKDFSSLVVSLGAGLR